MSQPPHAGSLVFLDLPPKTFIGIDLISFNSSAQFQGISEIPHGLHFLYSGTDASLSIRQGRWINLADGDGHECQIVQWNADSESLDLLNEGPEETQNVISSTTRVSRRGLLNYEALQAATSDLAAQQSRDATGSRSRRHGLSTRLNDQTAEGEDDGADAEDDNDRDSDAHASTWTDLTSYISPALLTRILTREWITTSISSAPSDTETIPGLSHLEANDALHQHPLRLLPIDLKQTWAATDVGRVRTDRARDRSWYLSTLIDTAGNSASTRSSASATTTAQEKAMSENERKALGASHVLGELQFCFLMVLTLANYSCLEQWKRLLGVIFTCYHAVREVEPYFVQIVRVLREQMRRVEDVEGGLFELRDEMASAWLRRNWARFRGTVEEVFGEDDGKVLKMEVEVLQTFFEDQYGWASERDRLRRGMLELEDGETLEVSVAGVDEDEERGEYAPVVVDT
ncbi:uncharacterized protein A1O9_04277 [Exophiala aquamarina CBS 119918]|uniref:AAR2 family protein n=1 Tax=Exophiala aquamarina CBS 119918 TaxID=1182545 RepID=A0A072PJE6_9EURO|nr:uncharacterized protein A1O9_04277 [Exophiala aquamarina CBS 119918]KEF59433.1 hypothetical protein A1O9_04277 [Exophiala aquamarina CBS 119918]